MNKISITYCTQWSYYPKAVSVADELKENFKIKAELIASGGGIFDVIADGKIIFSKSDTGRFPDEGEVSKLIKKLN